MSSNDSQANSKKPDSAAPKSFIPPPTAPSETKTDKSDPQPTTNKSESFHLPGFIRRLLQAGTPKQIDFQPDELLTLLGRVEEQYKANKCALIECTAPINICGDTHGQYTDLLRIFRACGAATKKKYLFLGDYVDRGRHSLEVITLLLALKLALPNRMFLLRGNHELKAINKNYGFYSELKTRFREAGAVATLLYDMFNHVFSWMPLAALVSGKILCMHGGISPKLESLDDIRKITLPLLVAKENPLACDLLWADPDIEAKEYQANTTRAISHVFGEIQVDQMCKKLNIDMIIRAHQVVEFGYAFFASKKLITVFSASRYQDELYNYAAVVLVSPALEISFLQLKPEDYEMRRKDGEKEPPTSNVKEENTVEGGKPQEKGPDKK